MLCGRFEKIGSYLANRGPEWGWMGIIRRLAEWEGAREKIGVVWLTCFEQS